MLTVFIPTIIPSSNKYIYLAYTRATHESQGIEFCLLFLLSGIPHIFTLSFSPGLSLGPPHSIDNIYAFINCYFITRVDRQPFWNQILSWIFIFSYLAFMTYESKWHCCSMAPIQENTKDQIIIFDSSGLKMTPRIKFN